MSTEVSEAKPTRTAVEVTANYLPAEKQFRRDFERTRTLGEVKQAIMEFFGVRDFTDRDTHTFHLLFEGGQRDDLATTLETLLRNERHTAHFHLIERIQAG